MKRNGGSRSLRRRVEAQRLECRCGLTHFHERCHCRLNRDQPGGSFGLIHQLRGLIAAELVLAGLIALAKEQRSMDRRACFRHRAMLHAFQLLRATMLMMTSRPGAAVTGMPGILQVTAQRAG